VTALSSDCPPTLGAPPPAPAVSGLLGPPLLPPPLLLSLLPPPLLLTLLPLLLLTLLLPVLLPRLAAAPGGTVNFTGPTKAGEE
jgi:hypothetical protein